MEDTGRSKKAGGSFGDAARDLIAIPISGLAAMMLLGAAPVAPPEESVTPLAAQALPDGDGKQFTAVKVRFHPGARATPHRHGRAFLYAYVLEGDVRSQLEGERLKAYHVGQSWIERPGAHHLVTENSSATRQARLLVTFISQGSEPLKVPGAR